MSARAIRLPDRFYLPRTDAQGREVRDVMPWEGAVSYATDGEQVGVQFADGRVQWLGRGAAYPSPQAAAAEPLADDFAGVDMEALVSGMRSYMDMHPVLKTVWREDLETLDALRARLRDEHGAS